MNTESGYRDSTSATTSVSMQHDHGDLNQFNVSHAYDNHGSPDAYDESAYEEYGYNEYSYYGYDEYEYVDHFYEIFDFEKPIYGYIWPMLVIFTTCCNCLVIGGFLRKRMRNATNLILVFIAVSDSFTGLVTLPATFHIFAEGNYLLTKDWCDTAMITRLYVSRAFHTVSVWETLLLCVYRFIQIRHPDKAKKLCTVKRTLAAIVVIYILSFILHVYHAFDIKAEHGMCQWTIREPCGWTCVYIWLTLLLCHIMPSLALVALATSIFKSLKLISQQSRVNKRRQKQRSVTLVVILIVVIFLVPELPYGIFYLTTVSLRHTGRHIFPLRTNRLIHCVYEILLVISFHLNFWVYCIMIRNFRSCIKSLLRLATCRPVNFERLEGEATSSTGGDLELVGMTTDTSVERSQH